MNSAGCTANITADAVHGSSGFATASRGGRGGVGQGKTLYTKNLINPYIQQGGPAAHSSGSPATDGGGGAGNTWLGICKSLNTTKSLADLLHTAAAALHWSAGGGCGVDVAGQRRNPINPCNSRADLQRTAAAGLCRLAAGARGGCGWALKTLETL